MRRPLAVTALLATLLGGGFVFAPFAAAADAAVTVDVSPASPRVGEDVTVSGNVTDADGQPVANTLVSATRTDSDGDHPLAVMPMTNESGHYSFSDTPTVHGDVTWKVTWQRTTGDVIGKQTVTVTRKPTDLGLDVSDDRVTTGTQVTLTAHLDSPTTDRTVSIYARPYGQDRELVQRGAVDADGELKATYDVARGTTFKARFDGDDAYAPATARRAVTVRARLADHLVGSYGSAQGYALYHVGDDATVKAHLRPELEGVCLFFHAQRRQGGEWRKASISNCMETNASGRATGELKGNTVQIDKPYRVRAEWQGGRGALPDNGPWLRLRFRG